MVVYAYKGHAELTFGDEGCLLVPMDRVLMMVTAEGDGVLRIAPGAAPPITEIVDALSAGTFVLTFDGGMLVGKPEHWLVKESAESLFEMLLVFESVYGHTGLAPTP